VAGRIFTTGTWYFRLANALRNRRVGGALTTAFRALDNAEQRLVEARLDRLPASIGLLDYRNLVPVMTALNTSQPVNMLAADAIATARSMRTIPCGSRCPTARRDWYDASVDQVLVERYRNHWVAVGDDGNVVAHDLSFETLDEILSAMPPVHVVIRRIPAANEPLFVGVW
jgi:hypothetical protein